MRRAGDRRLFRGPGRGKDVPDLHAVGFPIAEIDDRAAAIVGKAERTGGLVPSAR
jgi:hypothetical protein